MKVSEFLEKSDIAENWSKETMESLKKYLDCEVVSYAILGLVKEEKYSCWLIKKDDGYIGFINDTEISLGAALRHIREASLEKKELGDKHKDSVKRQLMLEEL